MAMNNLFGIDVSRRSDKPLNKEPAKSQNKKPQLDVSEDASFEDEKSAPKELQPDGGDRHGYMMFYVGPGYEDRSRTDVEKYAVAHGMRYIYWASDEAYGYKGMYNGDMLVTYRDVASLPKNYREDAERHGKLMPDAEKALQAERYENLSSDDARHMTDVELSDAALAYQESRDEIGD